MLKSRLGKLGAGFMILLAAWLVMAQSCMKFRISDSEAVQNFAAKGVKLETNTITVNHHSLHYVKTGVDSLPTIFFVHGSPGSWDAFASYMEDSDLLKKYRMVSVDRPGFGYSDFGDALPLEQQSKIISPLFQLLKNEKPLYLVGHSLGGPMIVQLAADNPGLVDALVILAGSIDPSEEMPERWRTLLLNNPLKYFVPGAMRPSNMELWYLKKDLALLKPRYAGIHSRVYILHGNKDQLVPYGNLAFGAKAFVNAAKMDTITIPGANHFIPWTHYREIKTVLMQLY